MELKECGLDSQTLDAEYNEKVRELNAKLADETEKYDQLLKKFDELQSGYEAVKSKALAVVPELETLRHDDVALRTMLSQIEAENSHLKHQYATVRAQLGALETKFRDESKDNANVIAALHDESRTRHEVVERLLSANQTLERMNREKDADVKLLRHELEQAAKSIEEENSARSVASRDAQENSARVSSLMRTLTELQGAHVDLLNKFETVSEAKDALQSAKEKQDSKLASNTREIDEYLGKISALTSRLDEAQASLTQAVLAARNKDDEYAVLRSDLALKLQEAMKKTGELEANVHTLQAACSEAQTSLQATRTDLDLTKQELEEARASAETSVRSAAERFAELEQAHLVASGELSRVSALLEVNTKELVEAKDKVISLSGDLEDERHKSSALATELANSESSLKNERSITERLSEELGSMQSSYAELEKMLNESQSENSALQMEFTRKEIELKNEVESIRLELEGKTSEFGRLKGMSDISEAQLNEAKAQIQQMEDENSKLIESLNEVSSEKSALSAQLTETTCQLENLKASSELDTNTLRSEKEKLEQSLKDARMEVVQLHAVEAGLRADCGIKDNELKALTEKSEEDMANRDMTEQQLREQIESISSELDTRTKENRSLRENVARMDELLTDKTDELEKVAESFEALQKSFTETQADFEEEIKNFEAQVSELSATKTQLESRVSVLLGEVEQRHEALIESQRKFAEAQSAHGQTESRLDENIKELSDKVAVLRAEAEEAEAARVFENKQHAEALQAQERLMAAMSEQVQNLVRLEKELKSEVDAAAEKHHEMTAEKASLETEVSSLKRDLLQKVHRIEEQEALVKEFQGQLAKSGSDLIVETDNFNKASAIAKEKAARLSSVEKELQELKVYRTSADSLTQELSSKLTMSDSRLQIESSGRTKAETHLKDVSAMVNRLSAEKLELLNEVKYMAGKLSASVEDSKAHHKKMNVVEGMLTTVQKQQLRLALANTGAGGEGSSLKSTMSDTMSGSSSNLEQELRSSQMEVCALKVKLAELSAAKTLADKQKADEAVHETAVSHPSRSSTPHGSSMPHVADARASLAAGAALLGGVEGLSAEPASLSASSISPTSRVENSENRPPTRNSDAGLSQHASALGSASASASASASGSGSGSSLSFKSSKAMDPLALGGLSASVSSSTSSFGGFVKKAMPAGSDTNGGVIKRGRSAKPGEKSPFHNSSS